MKKKSMESLRRSSVRTALILGVLAGLSCFVAVVILLTGWTKRSWSLLLFIVMWLLIISSLTNYSTSQDKGLLKNKYVIKHDERNIAIRRRVFAWMFWFNVFAMLGLGLLYRDMSIGRFISRCSIFEFWLYGGLYFIFDKKM